MEFLNPTALYGLFAAPLLLIPYLIRRRPRPLVFSSLLLFMDLDKRSASRPWGKLRVPPIFFLQLLLLLLLVFSLGEPVFSLRPSIIAIVLDNSASMQALEQERSRFALAKKQADALIGDLGTSAKVDLYVTLPRLHKIHGHDVNSAEAAALLSRLEPVDLGDEAADYNVLFAQLIAERDYDRVYFVTDRPARVQGGKVRVITVGRPAANLAITSFQTSRSSLVNPRLQAAVEVTNFSSQDARLKVTLKGGGAALSNRALVVPAGEATIAKFEGFPHRAYYEAEIDARDALALDNKRFAIAPSAQQFRVLGVSPRPQALASLRAIAGITVDLVSPAEYQAVDRSDYGLEIFHLSAPAVLPSNSTLLILPPDNNGVVELQDPLVRPVVTGWREPHPLTRYVNFALFRPNYARPLKANAAGESIIESPAGALAFSVKREGSRHLVLGFDPLPYLGRDNLPVSVFTLNVMDWFVEASQQKALATGEPLLIGGSREKGWLVTPRGEKISPNPDTGRFAETLHQGIYELHREGRQQFIPLNFHDPTESDLRHPGAIEIRGESADHTSPSTLFALWPYLLLLCFLLLLIEWFINPWRVSRAPLGVKALRAN